MKAIIKIIFFIGIVLTLNSCKVTEEQFEYIEEINFEGNIVGCSDFFISKLLNNDNQNIALTISGIGRENLNLTSSSTTFNIPLEDIQITISEWDIDMSDYYCNDAVEIEPQLLNNWEAVDGNITISVDNITPNGIMTLYDITIYLDNIIFQDDDGNLKKITTLTFSNVNVGWLPG